MRIGFSGHRPNRIQVEAPLVRARLVEVLTHVGAQARSASEALPVAVSALAEGSDRMFAECALECGFTLEALLPMPVEDYLMTFSNKFETEHFHALLTRASSRRQLPGSGQDRKAAYESLGRAMVETCDMLVVVWDGKPAAGRGGTPEVIEYALARGRRVIWIDAGTDRPARTLHAVKPAIDAGALA